MNIVLVGFSTTGKSQVARRAARLLGWEWVDTDQEIERQAGKPIPRIFAEDGEAHFRQWESRVLRQALAGEGHVIATGGGAVLGPANRELMAQRGLVVLLEASPETIYQRLAQDPENPRPLLQAPDPLARIRELRAQRQPFYSFAHRTIPTDALLPQAVARRAMTAWKEWGTPAAVVETSPRGDPVWVRWGGLEGLGGLMREQGLRGHAVIISDEEVYPHFGSRVAASLEGSGFSVLGLSVPAGEGSKTLEKVGELYES